MLPGAMLSLLSMDDKIGSALRAGTTHMKIFTIKKTGKNSLTIDKLTRFLVNIRQQDILLDCQPYLTTAVLVCQGRDGFTLIGTESAHRHMDSHPALSFLLLLMYTLVGEGKVVIGMRSKSTNAAF